MAASFTDSKSLMLYLHRTTDDFKYSGKTQYCIPLRQILPIGILKVTGHTDCSEIGRKVSCFCVSRFFFKKTCEDMK